MNEKSETSQARLKIAVFNRIFSKKAGGAERYSVALVEALAEKHEFHVFAQEISHMWPGVTYHRISAPLKRFRWLNQLWYATATWWRTRAASGHAFDIIHSHENTWHGNVQTVHVLPIKHNLFNGKTGWRKAGVWLKVTTSPRLFVYLVLERRRFASQNDRHIVVTSPSLQDIFENTYPKRNNDVVVITPGVAKAERVGDQAAVKRLLGLPENSFTIAFVGNRYDIKGLPTLMLALRSLAPQVNLLVVGNSEEVNLYQTQAEKLGIGSRVHFLGAINGVEQVYQATDCLAHPTLEDTFAMVVLEAMSYGLPVVVSSEKYCGIAGLLTNGLNALVLDEPQNASALSQLLKSIVDSAELRGRLSAEALKFADGFDWFQIARAQEQIYLKITSKTSPKLPES
jgi:glycosyltransferase involved in cell wall biosynthesis